MKSKKIYHWYWNKVVVETPRESITRCDIPGHRGYGVSAWSDYKTIKLTPLYIVATYALLSLVDKSTTTDIMIVFLVFVLIMWEMICQ